jgi:hypothetical protein
MGEPSGRVVPVVCGLALVVFVIEAWPAVGVLAAAVGTGALAAALCFALFLFLRFVLGVKS